MGPPGPSGEEVVVDGLGPINHRALIVATALQGWLEDAQRAPRRNAEEVAVGQLHRAGTDLIPVPPAFQHLAVPGRPRCWREGLLHLGCHRFFLFFFTASEMFDS